MSLQSLPDYTLRWNGPALVIVPTRWRQWLCDNPVDEDQRHALMQAVREFQPQALVVDLCGVELLPAICTHVLVQLARELDVIQRPGRMAIIGANPSVLDYLHVVHLNKLFDLQPTEAAALARIENVLNDSRADGE